MEEIFKLKPVYVNSKYIRLLYPIMALGLVIFILSTPFLEFTEFAPIILIIVIGWTIYDIYTIKKLKSFFVKLDDDKININDKSVLQWKDIKSVKHYSVGFGMQPIMAFNGANDHKIPAVVENLELLKNAIAKRLPEGCTVINN